MKCIYINLDRSSTRRDWMQKQADLMGLSFERVPAVDGRGLSDAEIGAVAGAVPRDQLSAAAVACFLSHRKAWENVVHSGAAHAAIFEDDIHFSDAAAVFLSGDAWVPQDADIVRLEVYLPDCAVEAAHIRTIGNRRLHRLRGRDLGSGAYIISRQCAERLLRDVTMISHEFDQLLFDPEFPVFSGLRTYKLIPSPCIQDKLHNTQAGVPGQSFGSHIERIENCAPERPASQSLVSKVSRETKRLFRQLRRAVMLWSGSKSTVIVRARYR